MPDTPASKPVVTRFAPSPTGELHIGGARTALFSWAFARGRGGTFLLRFEDTDQKRSSQQAEANILRDLDWLGLTADNRDDIPRQSQRLEHYNAAIDQLTTAGLAYDDDGAIRLKMDQDVRFRDEVHGDITVRAGELEDFVIRKADGFPTFHLAVVVDDAAMGVTHVIRGQEHLSNTPKHARLCDVLGYDRPTWVHTPSILNPDGSKMSKRDKAKAARTAAEGFLEENKGDVSALMGLIWQSWDSPKYREDFDELGKTLGQFMAKESDGLGWSLGIAKALNLTLPEIDVADFRRTGYLPEVLLNYIALLGWSPKDDTERFTLPQFAERFGFDGINRKNAKFDRVKLAAFNQEALAALTPEAFAEALRAHFAAHFPTFIDALGDRFDTFAGLYHERSGTLSDPATAGAFFVAPPAAYDARAVNRNLLKNDAEGLATLAAFRPVAAAIDPWTAPSIHAAIESFTAANQLKNIGAIAQPLRVALTGTAVSPPIDTTLELLGKDTVLKRIDTCLETVTPTA